MLGTQHGHLDYQTCCTWLGMIWAWVLHRAHGRWSDTVQPYRSVFPGRRSYQMQQCCPKVMPQWYQSCKSKFQRVYPRLLETVTRLSNVGNQLISWLFIAKKPVFMLLYEFMQCQTQLFSYLDNGYLHQTMKLSTAQEKSEQIFFALLKMQQYKFRDKHDCLPPSLCQKWRT